MMHRGWQGGDKVNHLDVEVAPNSGRASCPASLDRSPSASTLPESTSTFSVTRFLSPEATARTHTRRFTAGLPAPVRFSRVRPPSGHPILVCRQITARSRTCGSLRRAGSSHFDLGRRSLLFGANEIGKPLGPSLAHD